MGTVRLVHSNKWPQELVQRKIVLPGPWLKPQSAKMALQGGRLVRWLASTVRLSALSAAAVPIKSRDLYEMGRLKVTFLCTHVTSRFSKSEQPKHETLHFSHKQSR